MSFVPEELTKDKAIETLNNITKWANGGAPTGLITETQSNLTCSEAVSAAESAIAAVPGDNPNDTQIRNEAAYKAAFARDLKYAVAGRKHLQELGIHNALRGVYEGGKVAVDAKVL